MTSNSKSPAASDSSVSLALAPCASSSLRQLVVLDDHPLGRQLGGELDALDRFLVGRVGAADEQPVAALAQHHHLVLRGQLGVDDVARQALQVDRVRSSSGSASAVDRVCARSAGDTAPAAITAETKLVLRSLATADQVFGRLGVELAGVHQHPRHAGQG